MTSNPDRADRAVEILCDMIGCDALTASETLGELIDQGLIPDIYEEAAAGALAPDLPAPDEGEWEVGRNVISLDGMHILPMIDSDALTHDEARDLALALLAAAAHAQKEENDA